MGVSFFSYAVPVQPAVVKPGSDLPAVAVTGADRLAFLSEGTAGATAPFPRPAPVPRMPWIDTPERGWIAGAVDGGSPTEVDGATVTVRRKRFWPFSNTTRLRTDGNGYFGLAHVKPGRYEVEVQRDQRSWKATIQVEAGKVARVIVTPD